MLIPGNLVADGFNSSYWNKISYLHFRRMAKRNFRANVIQSMGQFYCVSLFCVCTYVPPLQPQCSQTLLNWKFYRGTLHLRPTHWVFNCWILILFALNNDRYWGSCSFVQRKKTHLEICTLPEQNIFFVWNKLFLREIKFSQRRTRPVKSLWWQIVPMQESTNEWKNLAIF